MTHFNPDNIETVFTTDEIERMKIELADIPEAAEILARLEEHGGDIISLAQEYAIQHPEEIETLNASVDSLNSDKDKE
jgi:hypothetical protein